MRGPVPLRPRRSLHLLWVLFGLLLGLAGALYVVWLVLPGEPTGSDPAHLLNERQALWAELASDGYALTGDLQAAQQRLAMLGMDKPGAFVAQVAESRLDDGAPLEQIRQMARLAEAMGGISARLLAYIATPAPTATATPMPTATPTATITPRPTATPKASMTPTAAAATSQQFTARAKELRCAPGGGPDVITAYVQDEKGKGVPGVRVEVSWAEGFDVFYTGLKPYVDPGYADFVMEPDVEYSLTVGSEGSDTVTRLRTVEEACPEVEGAFHHEWFVRFVRKKP